MATENYTATTTAPASADLSGSQYCGMVLDSNGNLAVAGAGVRIYGVLLNTPKALGQAGTLAQTGEVKMKMGASALAPNTLLSTDASGRAVAQASTAIAIGVLKETSGGVNSLATVELRLP